MDQNTYSDAADPFDADVVMPMIPEKIDLRIGDRLECPVSFAGYRVVKLTTSNKVYWVLVNRETQKIEQISTVYGITQRDDWS